MAEPFYRYVDQDGRTHIVGRLDFVPAAYRDQAELIDVDQSKVTLPGTKPEPVRRETVIAEPLADASSGIMAFVKTLHAPSVVTGFGLALVAYAVAAVVQRSGRMLLRAGIMFALLTLVSSAYFGWLRRSLGIGNETFVSPVQMVDDARKSSDRLQKEFKKQQRRLEKLEVP